MRLLILIAAIGVATVAVSAQEPKAVTALYEVREDGTVLVDWEEVEARAASKQNPVMLPQAQVMLAIRDGKWKPMIHAK